MLLLAMQVGIKKISGDGSSVDRGKKFYYSCVDGDKSITIFKNSAISPLYNY